LTAGLVLDKRYRLERPIGHGGMGEVWLARDDHLDRDVVVKLVSLQGDARDTDLVRRSRREALLMARLDHPGIPAVFDHGHHAGRPYIVMQKIDGRTVADFIAEHDPIPIGWAATIGAQVASALMAVHATGMVHRDLKPGNLMLDLRGAVQLLDFGVSTTLVPGDLSRITRTGESIGTYDYMAPEQLRAEETTPKTDIYGLGCTMYELLTGEPPFRGSENGTTLYRQHTGAAPHPPDRLRADIPVPLADLVLAMLAKRPEDRPSASVVCMRLTRFAEPLPALPGVIGVDTKSRAARAYLALCIPGPAAPRPQAVSTPDLDPAEVQRARHEAEQLIASARHPAAVRLLSPLADAAGAAFGSDSEDVLALRELLAQALFGAGEYVAAAKEFRLLARELEQRHGPAADRVVAYLRKAARAHAEMGENSRARKQLADLLDAQTELRQQDDPVLRSLRQELDEYDA
jgi:hypothetical protein